MTAAGVDANALWARAFAEELARAGVRDVCLAPGSRSTPLVLAFATHGGFRMRVHLDERSAGFFALGVGKATGMPAVVLTTSGTATGNLFPAVMEASQFETPLLVLTADRPHRLRDADANQALDQLRLFGPYVREFFELAPPSAEGPALRHLRTVAARALASAVGAPAGPVHLNVPLDKPLEPVAGSDDAAFAREHPRAARGRADGAPYVRVGPRRARLDDAELVALTEQLAGARRPLVVAGPSPEPGRLGPAALRLAAAVRAPLLADPLSGARYARADGACALRAYDLFLRDPRARVALRPDLVIRVGRSPSSAALLGYLDDCGAAAHLVIDPSHRWKDHLAVATDAVRADAADTLVRLAERLGLPAGRRVGRATAEQIDADRGAWLSRWTALEEAAAAAAERTLAGDPFEGVVARAVVRGSPKGGILFVSNSMPVRDVDAFGGAREGELRVLGNRGASGIDGIVSTALGVAAGTGEPVVALLGDVALLHDSNGLLAAREPDAKVVFVVVNNDGGAIFHFLPVRAHEPHFTPLFATPHGLDPARLAALYGLRHERVDVGGLAARLADVAADRAGGSVLLEVRSDRDENRRRRDAAVAAVRAAVASRLETLTQLESEG